MNGFSLDPEVSKCKAWLLMTLVREKLLNPNNQINRGNNTDVCYLDFQSYNKSVKKDKQIIAIGTLFLYHTTTLVKEYFSETKYIYIHTRRDTKYPQFNKSLWHTFVKAKLNLLVFGFYTCKSPDCLYYYTFSTLTPVQHHWNNSSCSRNIYKNEAVALINATKNIQTKDKKNKAYK